MNIPPLIPKYLEARHPQQPLCPCSRSPLQLMRVDFGGGGGKDASGAAGPDYRRRLRLQRGWRCWLEAKVPHEAAAADEVVKRQLALPRQRGGGVSAKKMGRGESAEGSSGTACYRGSLSTKA